MSETAGVPEEPGYLERARSMDFTELRDYIERSLDTVRSESITGAPKSREEFSVLLDMLYDRMTEIPDIPERLREPMATPAPEKPSERMEKSEQLRKLETWTTQARRKLRDASPEEAERVAEELRGLKQDTNDQRTHDRRLHREKVSRYDQVVREKRKAHTEYERIKKAAQNKRDPERQQIQRIESRVKAIFRDPNRPAKGHGKGVYSPLFLPASGTRTSRLSWRTLPKGATTKEDLLRYSETMREQGALDRYFDEERLNKALSLEPVECHVGLDSSSGYIIFTFDYSSRALMECPITGNAIYMIDAEDWQDCSRKTKQQLQQLPTTTKIVHQGRWFSRVREDLGLEA